MSAPDLAVEHLGADYFQDPYSVHARLRAQRPVTPVIMPGGAPVWLITGYAEARAALADPRLSKHVPGWHPEPDSIFASLDLHMLNSDPPDHERLRKLVNKAFTARRVERLRPRITAIAAGLLDDMSAQRDRPEVDLLASFAFPLPITVICELLGIPAKDRDDFRTWSATIVSDTSAPEVFQAHATAMLRYFTALLAAKRDEPRDDVLSALIAARDEGDRLSENELLSMAFLLLVAGHETTVNLIASGLLALLLNPAELARLRADPARRESLVYQLAQAFVVRRVTIEHVLVERGDDRVGRRVPARHVLAQPRVGQRGARLGVPGDQPGARSAREDHRRDRALRPQPGVHGVRIGEIVGAEALHGDIRRGHAFPSCSASPPGPRGPRRQLK